MQKNDLPQFAQALAGTWELHGKTISEDAIILFFNLMDEFSLEQVLQSLKQYNLDPERGMFVPKPADLIRYLKPDNVAVAANAWATAQKAVKLCDYNITPIFDDPIIVKTINCMGGWYEFTDIGMDAKPFEAKRFIELYQNFIGKDLGRQILGGTTGSDTQAIASEQMSVAYKPEAIGRE